MKSGSTGRLANQSHGNGAQLGPWEQGTGNCTFQGPQRGRLGQDPYHSTHERTHKYTSYHLSKSSILAKLPKEEL